MTERNRRELGLRFTWLTLAGTLFGFIGVVCVSMGANYNFYFNNTEQGNNSTAAPNLTVTDGKVSSSGAGTTNAVPPTVVANPMSPVPKGEVAKTEPKMELPSQTGSAALTKAEIAQPKQSRKWFKLTASGAAVQKDANRMGYLKYSEPAFVLQGTVSFFRDLGLNAFGAVYTSTDRNSDRFYGAEFEFIPVHLTIGKLENFIDLGVAVGANNARQTTEIQDATAESKLSYRQQSQFGAHLGFRTSINIGNEWSITAGIRGGREFAMAEAGLSLKL